MKKLIFIIVSVLLSVNSFGQGEITGATQDWSLKRAVMNANYDSLFNRIQTGSVVFISDTTINSLELNTLLDTHSEVVLTSGIFEVDSSVLVPSNTTLRIATGALLKLADNTNSHLIRNASLGYTTDGADTTKIDSNIVICGGGILDGNGDNQNYPAYVSGSFWNRELFWLHGINNLKFRDLELKNANTFASRFSKLENFVIENIKINQYDASLNNGDGIHMNGSLKNGRVINIFGNTISDDFLAIVPTDSPVSTWGYVGEGTIEDVIISDISCVSTRGVRTVIDNYDLKDLTLEKGNYNISTRCGFFDGTTYSGTGKLVNFTLKDNVYNFTTNDNSVASHYLISTDFENMLMENEIMYNSGRTIIDGDGDLFTIDGRKYYEIDTAITSIITLTGTIEKVFINNVSYEYLDADATTTDRTTQLIDIQGSVSEIEIKDCDLSKARYILSSSASTDTIDKITIRNCKFNDGRREPFLIGKAVRQLIIQDCNIRNISKLCTFSNVENVTIKNSVIDSTTAIFDLIAGNASDTVYLTLLNNQITQITGRPFRFFSNTTTKYLFIHSEGNILQYESTYEDTPLYSDTPTFNKVSWSSKDFVINTTYVNNSQDGDYGIFISGGNKVPAYYSNGNWYNLIDGTTL